MTGSPSTSIPSRAVATRLHQRSCSQPSGIVDGRRSSRSERARPSGRHRASAARRASGPPRRHVVEAAGTGNASAACRPTGAPVVVDEPAVRRHHARAPTRSSIPTWCATRLGCHTSSWSPSTTTSAPGTPARPAGSSARSACVTSAPWSSTSTTRCARPRRSRVTGGVRGAVVDDDDLVRLRDLRRDARERRLDPPLGVARDEDGRDAASSLASCREPPDQRLVVVRDRVPLVGVRTRSRPSRRSSRRRSSRSWPATSSRMRVRAAASAQKKASLGRDLAVELHVVRQHRRSRPHGPQQRRVGAADRVTVDVGDARSRRAGRAAPGRRRRRGTGSGGRRAPPRAPSRRTTAL